MTKISGANEESAFNAWIADGIAKGQRAAAEKAAAAKAVADAGGTPEAESGSTVVKLSDEAKAKNAANNWLRQSMAAIKEKARIEEAKWLSGVQTNGTENTQEFSALFRGVGAAEKEAYVQRQMIWVDANFSINAVIQKHREIIGATAGMHVPTEDEIAQRRLIFEKDIRQSVDRAGGGSIAFGPATETAHQQNRNQPDKSLPVGADATSTVHMPYGLERLRQKMGAGILGKSDADPAEISKQLAVAQQRIDALESEYGVIAEVRKKAAERGEQWALPRPPSPAASNAPAKPFRYEESNEMYLTNVAYLPLEMARKSLEFGEYLASSNALDGINLNACYGDRAINDAQTYIAALKDHISKLENGGTYLVRQHGVRLTPASQ